MEPWNWSLDRELDINDTSKVRRLKKLGMGYNYRRFLNLGQGSARHELPTCATTTDKIAQMHNLRYLRLKSIALIG